MKKVLICILLLTLLVCGCKDAISKTSSAVVATEQSSPNESKGENSSMSDNSSKTIDAFGDFSGNIEDLVDNQTPYQKKITKKYPEQNFVNQFLLYTRTMMTTSYAVFFGGLIQDYPAECIRKTDSTLYCMYETEEGGLFYVFFNEAWEQPGNPSFRHAVYVKKRLEKKDFNGIQKGMKIQEVEKIDPVTSSYLAYVSRPDLQPFTSFTSAHLLTDGILVIQYHRNQENKWVIDEWWYNKSYKWYTNDVVGDVVFDYTILPQDYIQ